MIAELTTSLTEILKERYGPAPVATGTYRAVLTYMGLKRRLRGKPSLEQLQALGKQCGAHVKMSDIVERMSYPMPFLGLLGKTPGYRHEPPTISEWDVTRTQGGHRERRRDGRGNAWRRRCLADALFGWLP